MSVGRIVIDALPGSADEFTVLRDHLAQDPEGGAATTVIALLLHAEDETLGRACLALAIDSSRLQDGPHGYGGRELRPRDRNLIRSQIARQPYLPLSYIEGATPGNGYVLPQGQATIAVSRNLHSGTDDSGRVKVFVTSSGADSPRPVTLVRDGAGLWRAAEWSSLLSGIRSPIER